MGGELAEIVRRERPYATYFDSCGDKPGTELGVVFDWLFARYENQLDHFASYEQRSNPFDPPDVVLFDHQGGRHGIEVTEFVDGPTISANAKRRGLVIREYEETEFHRLVSERITEKTGKSFKDPPYISKRLIIYSDEPSISDEVGVMFPSRCPPVLQTVFDEVWFITPPAVHFGGGKPMNPHCCIYEIKSS